MVYAEGQVMWQGDYLPFGEVIVTGDEVGNSIRFPGQYFDAETGLHYNWNRYYDPATGRYISADPIGLDGGINLYAYVGGDPVNRIDPEGLKSIKDWYNGAKDAKGIVEKCKGIFDENGKIDCECGDIGKCTDCTQTICETYGPVGSTGFGACIAPMQKACYICLEQ